MVRFNWISLSSVAVFRLTASWSFLSLKRASASAALRVKPASHICPSDRERSRAREDRSSSSRAKSVASRWRLRWASLPRMGRSRGRPRTSVSEGLENVGRKWSRLRRDVLDCEANCEPRVVLSARRAGDGAGSDVCWKMSGAGCIMAAAGCGC